MTANQSAEQEQGRRWNKGRLTGDEADEVPMAYGPPPSQLISVWYGRTSEEP